MLLYSRMVSAADKDTAMVFRFNVRLGQKQTFLYFQSMSALPPIPDNMNDDIESLCRALVWNVLGPYPVFISPLIPAIDSGRAA